MDPIAAFTEGNSFVATSNDKLFIGNSIGIAKVFNVADDEEPKSFDIVENLTGLAVFDNQMACTNTDGKLQLIDLDTEETRTIFRSELPLRDCIFINEGKRVVVGGDDNKLVFINMDNYSTNTIDLSDQMVNLSYNIHHELITVSLSNGNLLVYSVINEQPNIEETITKMLPKKVHTLFDEINYEQEHKPQLICTKTLWNNVGDELLVPTLEGINILDRKFTVIDTIKCQGLVDFLIENDTLIMLTDEIIVQQRGSSEILNFKINNLGINLALNKTLFIGTTRGLVLKLEDLQIPSKKAIQERPESDGNDTDTLVGQEINRNGIDDSIIDDDMDFPYNLPVKVSENGRKRQKLLHEPLIVENQLEPYSPGSTPFKKTGGVDRRYLSMNSIGYVWSVYNDNVQAVTVSFFDRSLHKDYHFNDYSQFDLCSINEDGILLGFSNVNQNQKFGVIYFRTHASDQDNWDKKIPLTSNEFITSISISNNSDNDEIIVVGTNMGYLRVYNKYGVCINIIKINPIVSIITNKSTIFIVTQLLTNLYAFSLIQVDGFKFLQQDCVLPLKHYSNKPLLKGIFFNELNDPCLVPGNDDVLIVLSNWRQFGNCTWIPILNCQLQTWKCWPLGLYNDKLNCLVLKNNDEYPGFPLSLPIELDLKLPINHQEDIKEEDHEETFVKATIMTNLGKDSLIDTELQEFNDEITDKLEQYTSLYEKSLLQLFVKACQASETNKGYSIAKLMKTDKALMAARKICERFEFSGLATKINRLRDNLVELD